MGGGSTDSSMQPLRELGRVGQQIQHLECNRLHRPPRHRVRFGDVVVKRLSCLRAAWLANLATRRRRPDTSKGCGEALARVRRHERFESSHLICTRTAELRKIFKACSRGWPPERSDRHGP
jgi:hypothetical protein